MVVRMASPPVANRLHHRRNRLSTSSTVMPTIVVSESASQAISSAVTAVARFVLHRFLVQTGHAVGLFF
jgi:hypothetical protein